MEWIEASGKTIEEAVEKVKAILEVDLNEIEVQVIEEPKVGMFGRVKTEAQIKARVKPRMQHSRPKKMSTSNRAAKSTKRSKPPAKVTEKRIADVRKVTNKSEPKEKSVAKPKKSEEKLTMEQIEKEKQIGEDFLKRLTDILNLEATVGSRIEDENIELTLDGENLGFLVGRKGVTLGAIQEITRQVVKNSVSERPARINIDVAQYRAKREDALKDFAIQVAQQVSVSKVSKAMEPMGAVDRRIVHNAVADIEGVETASAGIEPRRYVIIRPISDN
jgi:spoIIIJ-associated protein